MRQQQPQHIPLLLLSLLLSASTLVTLTSAFFITPPSFPSPSTTHTQKSRRLQPLSMIDNFFRLHEKNRQLQWDEYFGKARYDLPQVFGSCAKPLTSSSSSSPTAVVDEVLQQALTQLPACANLDLAIVAIQSKDQAEIDAVLAHLQQVLPGSTRVIGWAGPSLGEALAPSLDGSGAATTVVGGGGDGGTVSITLASIPSVSGYGFFVSEDELRAWQKEPPPAPLIPAATPRFATGEGGEEGEVEEENVGLPGGVVGGAGPCGPDKKWELRVGVPLNEAYKDPPVFLMLGKLQDASLTQVALQGLDYTYPGTARIGGVAESNGGEEVILFSREGGAKGPQGGRILKEEGRGLLGLALCGDIRALTYVNQGEKPLPEKGVYRIDAVSDDGKTITKVTAVAVGGKSMTPVEAGIVGPDGGMLVLGVGNEPPSAAQDLAAAAASAATATTTTSEQKEQPGSKKRDGADRWSLVSVRGSKQEATLLGKDGWSLNTNDQTLHLHNRLARKGQYLSFYHQDNTQALAHETQLATTLIQELSDEWSKPELGVMKFRPTGVLFTKSPTYPTGGLTSSFGQALADTLPTAPLAGLSMSGGQLAPLDPARTSGLIKEGLVVNVLACKAKRRDLREIRFDFSRREQRETKIDAAARSPLDLPYDPDMPLLNEETGEVVVNRQAALIGTDVRVDNMAWNVREESVFPTSLFESMVWTKERELNFVREDAPLLNLLRTVMMMVKNPDPAVQAKTKGLNIVEALQTKAQEAASKNWAVLGDVSRGTPFHGILTPLYDPVLAAKAVIEAGPAGAVCMRTDQTYYGGKYQHVRDVKDALREAKVPVVADDLVLYPYQLYLAKLFGADGVKMGLSVLSDEDLQYQVKICDTLSLTPIISVASLTQLRRAAALSLNQSSVLTINDRDWGTMRPNTGTKHRAVEWLQDAQVQVSLEARRKSGAGGGAPLLLVEGRSDLTEADKEELRGLGVSGEVLSYADLDPSVRLACAAAAGEAAVRGEAAKRDKEAEFWAGGGEAAPAVTATGPNSMASFTEMLKSIK